MVVFLCYLSLDTLFNYKLTENTDIRGWDLNNFSSKNLNDCCVQCSRDVECHSFTWNQNICWLKRATAINLMMIKVNAFQRGAVSGVAVMKVM